LGQGAGINVSVSKHGASVKESPTTAVQISEENHPMSQAPTPLSDISSISPARPLILGSTSRYRRELLDRLQWPFDVVAPEVDETPLPHEAPQALASRLALAKARAVAAQYPEAVVIGSDQVADLNGLPLGKPGDHARACAQLRQMSGQTVVFQTALAVVCQASGFEAVDLAPVKVQFRDLSDQEIEHYLRAEQPYDCAGSAKSEGLGIALLERIDSDDPTALIGLPLIRTCRLLRAAGLPLLGARSTP
jgi:septum formation protein